MDFDTNLLLVSRASIIDGVSMDFTVFQSDAFGNLAHIGSCYILVGINMIDFLLQEFWMSQLGSQITVVGQKKNTGRIAVQSSNRINAFATRAAYQIHNGLAVLRVVACRYVILWLIQQYIDFLFNVDRLVVEFDFIGTFYLGSQFCNHFTIYANHTGCDELICFTTRADSGIGQEFVQADWSIRIQIQFLIFNLFLTAVFCVRIIVGSAWT